jgi:hypothetical protein
VWLAVRARSVLPRVIWTHQVFMLWRRFPTIGMPDHDDDRHLDLEGLNFREVVREAFDHAMQSPEGELASLFVINGANETDLFTFDGICEFDTAADALRFAALQLRDGADGGSAAAAAPVADATPPAGEARADRPSHRHADRVRVRLHLLGLPRR